MNEISTNLRIAVIDAISPIIVEGVTIPIFDSRVNPSIAIPVLRGAKAYVIIRDQQEVETIGCKVGTRQNAIINLDCIAKYPANVGSKVTAELISGEIQPLINRFMTLTGWNLMNVTKVNSNSIVEQGLTETSFRKLITYSFDVFEE
jgi:hypothetical protein